MHQLDTDTAREVARDHQAQLRRDWQLANADQPEADTIQARRDRRLLRRLAGTLYPSARLSLRPRT